MTCPVPFGTTVHGQFEVVTNTGYYMKRDQLVMMSKYTVYLFEFVQRLRTYSRCVCGFAYRCGRCNENLLFYFIYSDLFCLSAIYSDCIPINNRNAGSSEKTKKLIVQIINFRFYIRPLKYLLSV